MFGGSGSQKIAKAFGQAVGLLLLFFCWRLQAALDTSKKKSGKGKRFFPGCLSLNMSIAKQAVPISPHGQVAISMLELMVPVSAI